MKRRDFIARHLSLTPFTDAKLDLRHEKPPKNLGGFSKRSRAKAPA
jgi:hypothetical protein